MKLEQKARQVLKKVKAYKYAALIFLLGLVLMMVPQGDRRQQEVPAEAMQTEAVEAELEARLEQVLCQMDGVGKVKVLLTFETGMSYQYQTDLQTFSNQEDAEVQKETVLASDGSGKQVPLTVRKTYPTYQGALVLCQGADSPSVRLDVVNAVSDLTGLGSDKISVIKMKDD